MGDDDKPFACMEPECGMRFANEDHLSVHRRKHEMCLSLIPGLKANNPLSFVDQTPTPTKFLKNCDEVGLFQELNKSPFDEAFKKAAEVHGAVGKQTDISTLAAKWSAAATLETGDSLHTPCPTLPLKIHAIQAANLKREPEYIPLPGPTDETESTIGTPVTPDEEEDEEVEDGIVQEEEVTIVVRKSPVRVSPSSAEVSSTSRSYSPVVSSARKTSVQDTVIIEELSGSEIDENEVIIQENPLSVESTEPVASVGTAQSPQTVLVMSQVSNQPAVRAPTPYMVQVMLQLPTGELVPLPSEMNGQPSSSVGTPSVTSKLAVPSTSTGSTNASSSTKEKLKAALNKQNNVLRVRTGSTEGAVDSVIPTPVQPKLQTLLRTPSLTGQTVGHLQPQRISHVELQDADTSTPKRFKKTVADESDDRRRKFLERNRAAAARCRAKKKSWIGNLEKKADDMQSLNTKLQQEVNALRSETMHLKRLLLAHKDCPITLQQRSSGQIALQTVPEPAVVPITIPSVETVATPSTSSHGTSPGQQQFTPIILSVSSISTDRTTSRPDT